MRILVTGGMGAVGSFFAQKLVEKGMTPILYGRRRQTALIRDIEDKVVIVLGDILDRDKLVNTISTYDVDTVVHTAAMLSKEGESNPAMAIRVNVEGTANAIEAAVKCNVKRFVYTSAKGVYSEAKGEYGHPTYKGITEDYPAEANMGFYGLTKLFGEKVVLRYQVKYGIDTIILRFSGTYGPGKTLTRGTSSPIALIGKIIENAMHGKPTRIPQGGEQQNDFIYYKDVANGILAACAAKNVTHRIFNIGSGKGTTLLGFANAVKQVYPNADLEIGPGLDFYGIGFNVYSVYDITRAQRELGFSPQYDLASSIRDYVDTLRKLNIEPVQKVS